MERDKALQLINEQLPEKRYIHTLGVAETAVQLAENFGYDPKRAELAAIFHDYAKYRPEEEMREVIIREQLPANLLNFHTELWHAPVGAFLVKEEVGIDDPEILQAIASHTTGRPSMGLLEKIIFLADYIEPGRSFPGVEEVREIAKQDLDQAVLQALQNTIIFLAKKKVPIYPDTIATYNDFLMKKGGDLRS